MASSPKARATHSGPVSATDLPPDARLGRARFSAAAWALLPIVVTALLYLPACVGADWITDDRYIIAGHLRPGDVLGEWTTATHAHAADVVGGYLWRPVTSTVYQLWAAVMGREVGPFRLLSAGVHLLNVALIMLAARRFGASARVAALGALAWGVHPLLPDAVCWVSDLYDVLAATFLLGGLVVAARPARGHWPVAEAFVGSLLFFAALLSKEAALAWLGALPVVLFLMRGWRPAVTHAVGLVVVAALHSGWHAAIVGSFSRSTSDVLLQSEFLAVWTDYLRWPIHLPVRAGYTHLVTPGAESLSIVGLAVMVGALGAFAWAVRRPLAPAGALAAGLVSWVVLVSPGALAAAFFLNQSARYLYLPMALATPLLAVAAGQVRSPRAWTGWLAVGGWLAVMTPMTVGRVADWQTEAHLYAAEVAAEPDNPFAVKELGRQMVAAGQGERGLALWQWALENPPASTFVMDVQSERLDYAQAALSLGQTERALTAIDAFVADEARSGRAVDPSVLSLREQIVASLGAP
jgi:hypothetical protein